MIKKMEKRLRIYESSIARRPDLPDNSIQNRGPAVAEAISDIASLARLKPGAST
jgi:hypothetical protein